MAIQSTQYAGLVSTPRVRPRPVDSGNHPAMFTATTPTVYASQAIAELFDLCILPSGTRLFPGSMLECAAGAAASTMNVGIRSLATGAVISATQIATGANLTAAGMKPLNTGLAFAGLGYICLEDVIVYATFTGAASTANQAITIYLDVALIN